jgi:hypothetical protein
MKLYKVTKIVYDFTGGGKFSKKEQAKVPKSFYVLAEDEDSIADKISDETGWLVSDLQTEVVATLQDDIKILV